MGKNTDPARPYLLRPWSRASRGTSTSMCVAAQNRLQKRGRMVLLARLSTPSNNNMLTRVFYIIFPVFGIAAIGYLYSRYKRVDIAFANQLNMDLFVPALVL